MIEMELVGVRVEMPGNTPIVLLRERSGEGRLLPIFIGNPEATAIALALEDVVTPRPMTHDLLREVVEEFGAEVDRVVVTDLRDKTFFADLHMRRDDELHVVSSRPSDAIALAARTKSPIFADEAVLDEAGYLAADDDDVAEEGEDADAVVEQFRDFIDNVSPEDFEN